MMNVNDIANRALTQPKIYVPALTDEIQRLRTRLALYESAFDDIKALAISSGLWSSQQVNTAAWVRRVQRLNSDIQTDTQCSQ